MLRLAARLVPDGILLNWLVPHPPHQCVLLWLPPAASLVQVGADGRRRVCFQPAHPTTLRVGSWRCAAACWHSPDVLAHHMGLPCPFQPPASNAHLCACRLWLTGITAISSSVCARCTACFSAMH